MDRSRISNAVDAVVFLRAAALAAADVDPAVDVVVIDLAKHQGVVAQIRTQFPHARLVGFAPHVDEASTARAGLGVDEAMARSRFFRDPAHALARAVGEP